MSRSSAAVHLCRPQHQGVHMGIVAISVAGHPNQSAKQSPTGCPSSGQVLPVRAISIGCEINFPVESCSRILV